MTLVPRTAAYRIGLVSGAAFASATAAIGLAVFFAVHSAFIGQLDEAVAQAHASLVSDYRDDGPDGLVEAISHREAGSSSILGFALFDRGGRRIAGRLDTALPPSGWSTIAFRDPEEGRDPARALTSRLPDGTFLVVSADLEPAERMDETILTVFGFAFVASVLIGTALAIGLGRYLKRRLDAIALGSEAFAAGNQAGRAVVGRRGDEFDQLATSLNAMLDRIDALLTNLRQVTSDLAHDLRTPLTRLRNELDGLRTAADDERDARLDRAVERSDDILRMFGAILRISELEGGDARRHFASVDLTDLARELFEAHEPVVEECGKSLVLDLPPVRLQVLGDRELLAQAMINLFENALRHSPPGGAIVIGVLEDGGGASLQMRDGGPGIAPADRARVTERFVRLEAARTSPGYGLGLALVKAIADAHGARLVLGDAGPGLDARIVFPAVVSS